MKTIEILQQLTEIIPIPTINKEDWNKLDIHELILACGANLGRSILAEAIIKDLIQKGRFPNIWLSSRALQKGYERKHDGYPHPITLEVLREKGIPDQIINSLRSQCLGPLTSLGSRTDVVLLVPHRQVYRLRSFFLGHDLPKSVTCIPREDPSGEWVELSDAELKKNIEVEFDFLKRLIEDQLLGIIANVRERKYRDYRVNGVCYDQGISFPFGGIPEPRSRLWGVGELGFG